MRRFVLKDLYELVTSACGEPSPTEVLVGVVPETHSVEGDLNMLKCECEVESVEIFKTNNQREMILRFKNSIPARERGSRGDAFAARAARAAAKTADFIPIFQQGNNNGRDWRRDKEKKLISCPAFMHGRRGAGEGAKIALMGLNARRVL